MKYNTLSPEKETSIHIEIIPKFLHSIVNILFKSNKLKTFMICGGGGCVHWKNCQNKLLNYSYII